MDYKKGYDDGVALAKNDEPCPRQGDTEYEEGRYDGWHDTVRDAGEDTDGNSVNPDYETISNEYLQTLSKGLDLCLPDDLPEFKQYRRTNIAEMRDIGSGESKESLEATGVSISDSDMQLPLEDFLRGKVARNPEKHETQWYVAEDYFKANFIPLLVPNKIQAEIIKRLKP